MPATATSYLHIATLLRLLAVMAFVLLPHAAHLPKWEIAAVIAVIGWRAWAARRLAPMPSKWIRGALALAAFAGVMLSYGRVNGQHAGVALLVIMAALKLTEMDQRRDVMVLVFLMYFLCSTHFLFSQELWTLLYLLVATTLITAVLIEANHAGLPLAPRITLRRGGSLIAQSLPLMLLMFVLFPRVPGPLWGLPADAGAARSGLSDRMSPGDIASLIQSDELAFRVRFDGPAPQQQDLYWRGPVFWAFDGREWTEGGPPMQAPYPVQFDGPALGYEVTLEPHRATWLFVLDAPDPAALPENSWITADGRLLSTRLVRDRLLYRAVSHLRYRAQTDLPDSYRRFALRLPRNRNPRTVALAQQWRAEGLDDAAVVQAALRMYREQSFFYTLKPPVLDSQDPVDQFLFETHRGFCEHYASSFTTLMRAAGIPARVVTGYQGGRRNDIGDYYIVQQSDAHAWSEVWLAERGWVRVDPTAAVAPNRIERNLESALSLGEQLPFNLRRSGSRFYASIGARWDWVNAQWNRWVLAYGPDLQKELLSRFGLEGWRDLMLSLIVAMSLVGGLVGLIALRRALPPRNRDEALRLWQTVTGRLARTGLIQRPQEGPQDFATRVLEERPDLAATLRPVLAAYLDARYSSEADAVGRLATLVRRFRPAA